MSVSAAEDDSSAMAVIDNQSSGVDQDAALDFREEAPPPHILGENPRATKVEFYDGGDLEDPEDPFSFPSASESRILFTDATRAKRDTDGKRKSKSAPVNLSNAVHFHLCQWMHSNYYVYGLGDGASRTTIETFE